MFLVSVSGLKLFAKQVTKYTSKQSNGKQKIMNTKRPALHGKN